MGQDRSADDYNKCLKAIAEHARTSLTYGQEMFNELTELKKQEPKRPEKVPRKDDAGKDIAWNDVDQGILARNRN